MNQVLERHYWILTSDPRQYHWDTLFVKGKEMCTEPFHDPKLLAW